MKCSYEMTQLGVHQAVSRGVDSAQRARHLVTSRGRDPLQLLADAAHVAVVEVDGQLVCYLHRLLGLKDAPLRLSTTRSGSGKRWP